MSKGERDLGLSGCWIGNKMEGSERRIRRPIRGYGSSQVRKHGSLDQGGTAGDGESQQDLIADLIMRDTRLSEYDRKRQIKDELKVLGLRNWKVGTDMSRTGEGFSIRMMGEGLDIRSSIRCDNCKMPPGHSSGDIKWVERRRSTFIPEHLETYLTSCFLSLGDPLLSTEHWEQSCREDS